MKEKSIVTPEGEVFIKDGIKYNKMSLVYRGGEFFAVCGKGISFEMAKKFVYSHLRWMKRVKERKVTESNAEGIFFMGKRYNASYKNGIFSTDIDGVRYSYCVANEWEGVDKLFLELSNIRLEYYARTLGEYAKKYGDTRPKIKMRAMSSRWGTYNVKNDVITINTYLVQFDEETQAYLLFHEFCHKIEQNHSERFHKLVQREFPNEKEYYNRLKTISAKRKANRN